jgi:hypothetical protein
MASQEKGYDQLVICKPLKRDGETGWEKRRLNSALQLKFLEDTM